MAPFVFFFPYRPVSGVPMLFGRLARRLGARGHHCQAVDYPDGCLAREIAASANVELVPFADGRTVAIRPDALVVMQAILPATMRPELQPAPETRLLFWVLHVMNFVQIVLPLPATRDWQARSPSVQRLANRTVLRSFQREMREYVSALSDHGSLVFMDGSTWQGTAERLEITPRRVFLPVLVEVSDRNPRPARAAAPLRRVGWLGRLDDFKIGILNHAIASSERVADQGGRDIEFVVIGDGPLADRLRQPATPRVRVTRLGTLGGRELDAALDRLDVLLAMGTSALEGGRLGVPTILLDFSYAQIPADYRFRWLVDARDFELGRLIDETLCGEDSARSLGNRFAELERDPEGWSQRTFEYCRTHHSLDSGVDAFLSTASGASYRYGQMNPRLRRKSWVRRGYERARAGWA